MSVVPTVRVDPAPSLYERLPCVSSQLDPRTADRIWND
jgi:hypothetical protein